MLGVIGKTLTHYEILSLLGEGGMGRVYRARDTRLDREVALKLLPPELARDRERIDRFRLEAKTLAALDHPGIVTIFSVEAEGETPFLTMQLVRGATLADSLPAGGIEIDELFAIGVALADALATAHASGVVHRDLKPANVMRDQDGRLRILDFGLAKLRQTAAADADSQLATAPLTAAGEVMGTVPYMPPEQIRGQPADERSDIFSLGVLLYELATGERPFRGETSADVMSAVLSETPSPVDARRPDLPPELARVIRRCLEKEPSRRYQSALDVRNECEDLLRERNEEAVLAGHDKSVPGIPAKRSRLPKVAATAFGFVAAIVAGILLWPRYEDAAAPTRQKFDSLGVLPFDNLMNDPEQDYFVDGMQETLITELSRIGGLRVISRTSMMRYRDTEKTAPEIARELDVDALIEGSVLRANGQVRINAQLIDGTTDEHLWAELYDRDLDDVLAVLSEVATAISDQIEVALTPAQRQRSEQLAAVDPGAQETLLKARYHFNRFTGDGLRQALEHGHEVVSAAPDWAPGHAMVAAAYMALGAFGHMPLDEAVPRSREAAVRAIALDDGLDEAHNALGWIRLYFDWDWSGAEKEFLRALEINPNDVNARHGYADLLTAQGRVDEGLAEILRGRQSDPLSIMSNIPVVGHMVFARRFEDALAECDRLADLDASLYAAVRFACESALWQVGRYEEAVSLLREMYAHNEGAVAALDAGSSTDGPTGAIRAFAEYRASLGERARRGALSTAQLFARVGEPDRAFEWLDVAFDERRPQLITMRAQPEYDPLKDDPRYEELVRRIGLPDPPTAD